MLIWELEKEARDLLKAEANGIRHLNEMFHQVGFIYSVIYFD